MTARKYTFAVNKHKSLILISRIHAALDALRAKDFIYTSMNRSIVTFNTPDITEVIKRSKEGHKALQLVVDEEFISKGNKSKKR